MAYNLIESESITIEKNGEDIKLNTNIEQVSNGTRNTTYATQSGYMSTFVYGKICIQSMNIYLENNIPANTYLISGLPNCKVNRYVFTGAIGTTAVRLYVSEDKIYADNAITTGGWISATVIYPIE